MGNQEQCYIDLKFNGLGNDVNKVCPDLMHFKRTTQSIYDFDNMKPLPVALIVPRQSKLTVKLDHQQPSLLGEWYEILISIINDEKYAVENLQLEIMLADNNIDQNSKFT